ncbi:MAG: ATP-binding cassette domain-containing protein [Spirochaetota bacterium]
MNQLRFDSVSFTYPQLIESLLTNVSFTAPCGWTGIVGANGSGKSTLLALATGRLRPTSGMIVRPDTAWYCEQRTDAVPAALVDLLSFPDSDAGRLVSILGIEADWPYRWDTLSHGERKRAQIAVALHEMPELLVVDEPTNHLDREARERLSVALASFADVGLIVSHDRALLDRLCGQCLFLEGEGRTVMRPGGVSEGQRQQARERLEQRRVYDEATRYRQRVEAEAVRRREEAAIQNRKRSKRGLRYKDSDAREKIDRARISGADGQAGRLLRQLDGRRAQAADRLAGAARPVAERVGVSVTGRRAKRDSLLRRTAGFLELPDGRRVRLPDLRVRPDDRIALQGPNGAGKSTLVAALLDHSRLADDPDLTLFIPQEISAAEAARLVRETRALANDELGRVISTVSRLASDPEQMLSTELPSPGEARKLMLALGLEKRPALVVMDEPTNHLDLVSMQCLEAALADFEGALLLVSHDEAFVRALARTFWRIMPDGSLEVSAMTQP